MNLIDRLEKEGWLILPGGADINPGIYGKENYKSHISQYSLSADTRDILAYNRAVKQGRPIFGICRGMQMMAALNGLSLIQNMSHGGSHDISAIDIRTGSFTQTLAVNNAHHQCVWTENKEEGENFKVYGKCSLSTFHEYQEKEQVECLLEPEIMHFPKIRGFATQFHPEWMGNINSSETLQYLDNVINKLF